MSVSVDGDLAFPVEGDLEQLFGGVLTFGPAVDLDCGVNLGAGREDDLGIEFRWRSAPADQLAIGAVAKDVGVAEIMDRYLTNGSRSIPVVIALGQDFRELGHWGPRPTEIQQWVVDNKDTLPSKTRYPTVRRWYAKDRGETTLREVLGMLERVTT